MTLALNQVHVGDVRQLLPQIPDDSIDCVVTSPPYWGLRDYGVPGQLGLEESPARYVVEMVAVFNEVRRVLKPRGTLWLNLGDSYIGSWGAQGRGTAVDGRRAIAARQIAAAARQRLRTRELGNKTEGLKPKDLVGIPWMIALALRNAGWWLRSEVIWHKANPTPEAVIDRPCRDHEQMFLLTKSYSYYYNRKAVMQQATGTAHSRVSVYEGKGPRGVHPKALELAKGAKMNPSFSGAISGKVVEKRNIRTVWKIVSEPYHGAHFATFPTKLVAPCILAGCPKGGVVLDPFAGSGTVAQVAGTLGRRWIMLELNEESAELARARIALGRAPRVGGRTRQGQLSLFAGAR